MLNVTINTEQIPLPSHHPTEVRPEKVAHKIIIQSALATVLDPLVTVEIPLLRDWKVQNKAKRRRVNDKINGRETWRQEFISVKAHEVETQARASD